MTLGHPCSNVCLNICVNLAIIEHPENPLKSQFAPSFLTAYRTASTILRSVSQQFEVWPAPSAGFWALWISAFAAGVVFGAIVTRRPRLPLAKSAMSELEKVCMVFSKVAVYSVRATKSKACQSPILILD
ncbi:hypothetical protein L208DRAFT_1418843 [Tricholoma matsutake]|nr:hypothetical protein L208DRAFT_1418843 [Tricholoma matsutake 945]